MIKRVFLLSILALLISCSDSFEMLGQDFDYSGATENKTLISKTINIYSKHHPWLYEYREIATVKLDESTLYLEVPSEKQIAINSNDIVGCQLIFFECDSTDFLVLIGKTKTVVGIKNAPELIDWCYHNNLPVINKRIIDQVFDNGVGSVKNKLISNYDSKATFTKKLSPHYQSCNERS